MHRTYGCTGTKPNPSPRVKAPSRISCDCKVFRALKAATAR